MAEQGGGLEGSQPVDLSKHPSGIVPTLQNIVSTVNLDCKLDLKQIALQARNAEYNPKRFAAVIMRIREPKTTALIFASGKMVCTGAKSEQQSKLAARKYARIIQKLGFPAKFKDFKIQNIVGSCDVKFPIRLEGLAYSHGAFSSYEPELFPGLIYRMKQPKIVLLIFVSGKIVITGAKVRDETYTAFENIYPVLTEFRKVQQWNIVSTVNLDCKLDLKQIALQARNAEYNPKDFKIQNIVGSSDVKFPIRLEGLAYFPSDLKDFKVNHCSALLTVYLNQKLCCSFLYLEKLLSQELRSEMKLTQHLRTYTLSLQSSGRSNSDSVMMICI
ncbi:hypothetical protein LWI29_016134 [Acer saccharum]|uniref:TATA-box-binding protein n=3 Tax=Acereae TaxID=1977919 RepID=A0AA39SY57_ACESA|nr:hypothetical protein LWI29_016134 [Acer saccharum]